MKLHGTRYNAYLHHGRLKSQFDVTSIPNFIFTSLPKLSINTIEFFYVKDV